MSGRLPTILKSSANWLILSTIVTGQLLFPFAVAQSVYAEDTEPAVEEQAPATTPPAPVDPTEPPSSSVIPPENPATPLPVVTNDTDGAGQITTQVVQTNKCLANSLNPCVGTNKPDYAPTEVVLISGHGFLPDTNYQLVITSETGPFHVEYVITTDEVGGFNYSYQLDGTYRPHYAVSVLDTTNAVIAGTEFLDDVATPVPFTDSFGSVNSATVTNWDESNAEILSGSGNDSSFPTSPTTKFAKVGENGWIRRTIDATGVQNLVLKFNYRGDSDAESNDDGRIQYCKGAGCTNFTTLSSVNLDQNVAAWSSQITLNLPTTGGNDLDNSVFRIRFLADSSQSDEYLRVDDVQITGEKIPPVTIKAYKVVCKTEADLPNWAGGGPGSQKPGKPATIGATTAQQFVAASQGHCWLASDWSFQWGFVDKQGAPGVDKLSGDHIGAADGTPSTCPVDGSNCGSNTQTGANYNNWKDFDSSTAAGVAAKVEIANLEGSPGIWVRENLQAGYVPFTYPPKSPIADNVSAEMYCHNDRERYDNFDQVSSPQPDGTYYCVAFNALKPAQLTIVKDVQPHNDPQDFNFSLYKGFQKVDDFDLDDDGYDDNPLSNHETFSLADGIYSVFEHEQNDWIFGGVECEGKKVLELDHFQGVIMKLEAGDQVTCTFVNKKKAQVIVTKFNDQNHNGVKDEGEETLPDWEINLKSNQNCNVPEIDAFSTQSLNYNYCHSSYQYDKTQLTGEDGTTTFTGVKPGVSHVLSETVQDGWTWIKTYCVYPEESYSEGIPSGENSYNIYPGAGDTIRCFIGNAKTDFTLVKTNNKPDPTVNNQEVTYTLTLQVGDTGSSISNACVTDLPPEGFTYIPGSETATSNQSHDVATDVENNGGEGCGATGGPNYGSPGQWFLGNLVPGEIITLTYKALISNVVSPGNYPDLAFASGNSAAGIVFANSVGGSSPFVGSHVNVIQLASAARFQSLGLTLPNTAVSWSWLSAILPPLAVGTIYFLRERRRMERSVSA